MKERGGRKLMSLNDRKAGILFPIFSLPSAYGIGTFGREAYAFADCLKKAGQTYWQMLPIGPTGYGDSPYQSFSTFAGNPYFIDLDTLKEEGLLTEEEIISPEWGNDPHRVDYALLYQNRAAVLEKAFRRFTKDADYEKFLREEGEWLDGYAGFMCGKEGRTKEYYCFVQYEFLRQWFRLKAYINSLGIRVIGDIPIYVAMDSADILSDRKMFQFDRDGKPLAVAGCPPDNFSAKGQLWGNPLYDWDYHEKTGYVWWVKRMRHCFRLYDVVRVDHFRGFDEYYSIPYGDEDAFGGKWEQGPGMKLFNVLKKELGDKPIIAEDLGYITESVRKLVKDTGCPGMKVLEFAFDSREAADYRPNTWTPFSAAYTGTHDNQTLASWFQEISPEDRKMAADYMGRTVEDVLKGDYVYDFIRMTMESVANTVIIPMQDYCRLTKEARINTPSTLGLNWTWRFTPDLLTDPVWKEIASMTAEYGRS